MDKNRTLKIAYKLCEMISAALHNKSVSCDEEDLDTLFSLCCKHKLVALVSSVLGKDTENYSQWENAFTLSVMQKTYMDIEREQLLSFLRKNGIWYMPMKGLVLENLYPDVHFREMCDNDILYAPEGYKIIKDYMLKRGYRIEHSSADVHVDEYAKEPYCFFEMHKRFFNSTRGKLAQYYQDMTDFLIDVDEFEKKLSDEDFYVYMIAHSYKHFIDAGTGLRSFVDCYLYNQKVSYDKTYVKRELRKLGIDDFEIKFRSFADKLFSGNQIMLTDDEEEILLYVVSSGAYGKKVNYIRNQLQNESKFRYMLKRAFPDLDWYKGHVPFCYKHKWAIPFYCVYRIFARGIKRRKAIKNEMKILKKTDADH